jgi:hypothetical protein
MPNFDLQVVSQSGALPIVRKKTASTVGQHEHFVRSLRFMALFDKYRNDYTVYF